MDFIFPCGRFFLVDVISVDLFSEYEIAGISPPLILDMLQIFLFWPLYNLHITYNTAFYLVQIISGQPHIKTKCIFSRVSNSSAFRSTGIYMYSEYRWHTLRKWSYFRPNIARYCGVRMWTLILGQNPSPKIRLLTRPPNFWIRTSLIWIRHGDSRQR